MIMWRKSSRSGSGDCVEVRNDLAAVRDSKNPGLTLPVGRTALSQLRLFARGR
ncbi:DUF397 domain-containing protein [Actinophytocola xinjiangensis]|uniref:DUF397 domain-containing protein n=1 Tax=Actinophytocola xinjiangensis TaxID=485602 RepID=UPI0009FDFE99|nr:DUF397 domain-containing protein [Actinophytocola xinjiangensis]